jgi:hypothetical protein
MHNYPELIQKTQNGASKWSLPQSIESSKEKLKIICEQANIILITERIPFIVLKTTPVTGGVPFYMK